MSITDPDLAEAIRNRPASLSGRVEYFRALRAENGRRHRMALEGGRWIGPPGRRDLSARTASVDGALAVGHDQQFGTTVEVVD